jgi:hypothetical protein
VVEEACQVPSHSLVTDLLIDSRALTSLHYSQQLLQMQLVGMQEVSAALRIVLLMVQLHCFATLAIEEAGHTMLMAFETADLSKLSYMENLGIHSRDSENWIWNLDSLGEVVEVVMTAGAILHHCHISWTQGEGEGQSVDGTLQCCHTLMFCMIDAAA